MINNYYRQFSGTDMAIHLPVNLVSVHLFPPLDPLLSFLYSSWFGK